MAAVARRGSALRTTVKLEEMGERTQLQLIWQPIDPTREEAEAFQNSRAQHGMGWGAGLEQLDLWCQAQAAAQEE